MLKINIKKKQWGKKKVKYFYINKRKKILCINDRSNDKLAIILHLTQ